MATPTPTSPLASFLGPLPPAAFLRDHYFRLPLARAGGAAALRPLADPGLLDRLLAAEGVDAFLALDGRLWEGGRAPDAATARRLGDEGWTAVVRNAQRHDAGLAALAEGFRRDLGAPVNVHVYATPAGRTGFGWHYDVEDVFILQAEGVKEYRLRKNTVTPWPVLELMGPDLHLEREISPAWPARLGPGDALYIPPGWWHRADGVESPSLTIAVGLMSPTPLSALDLLRRELVANPAWRQRLPVAGEASGKPREALEEEYEALFRELGRDLARALSDGALARRFLRDVTR
ncbi:MAG TPA: cupin domain-containing protein [Planctomycetota bacterium]|nr:cupin domain-containing protein [Planctomycetota bacterium]